MRVSVPPRTTGDFCSDMEYKGNNNRQLGICTGAAYGGMQKNERELK